MSTDPVVTEYVNRLGQNFLRNSYAKVSFTIRVLDTNEVNAFARPAGFFVVNSGLILEADVLGLLYMYKAEYDPTVFVDFFEKSSPWKRPSQGVARDA